MQSLFLFSLAVATCAATGVIQYDPSLANVVDSNATITTLYYSSSAWAHSGAVYINSTGNVYMTSNYLANPNNASAPKAIHMYTYNLGTGVVSEVFPNPFIYLGAAGTWYSPNQIIFVSAGSGAISGSLQLFNTDTLATTQLALTPTMDFNSPNDIFLSNIYNGMFFTDPAYAAARGFRNPPTLPPCFYYVNRTTLAVTTLYCFPNNSSRPNGIVHSLDGSTLYVSDTGYQPGTGSGVNTALPHCIWQWDMTLSNGVPVLSNQRYFLPAADQGIPDAVRVDEIGNVYTAVSDGVNIYNSTGTWLGKLQIPSGAPVVSNFNWAGHKLIINADNYIYGIDLKVGSGPVANFG